MMILSSLFTVLFTATLGNGLTVPSKRATTCNGHAELCNRSYGNVTFIGAHDSYAFSTNSLAVGTNQQIDVPTQLSKGVRLLQAQSHLNNGVLHFCHTSCSLFDGGTVADYLSKVKTFLDGNPTEVLTLLITNPDGLAVDTVWDPVFKSSGIDKVAFVPPSVPVKQSDWPTLGSLIASGKRVVVFMDAHADTTKVPYILPEFDMVWETPFDSTDSNFPCKVDRISGSLAQTDHMSLLNHFLDTNLIGSITVPDKGAAGTTNGPASILANRDGCAGQNAGRNPNFVLLDWVDIGNAFTAANQMNALA